MVQNQDFSRRISRRELLRWLGISGAVLALNSCASKQVVEQPSRPEDSPVATQSSLPAGDTPVQQTSQPEQQQDADQGGQPMERVVTEPAAGQAYLAAVHGSDPETITEAAIKALGGMDRFVKKGFDVILKPNICTDYYSHEYAATTNPVVLATLVKLALGAGAKRVRVMDFPFGGSAESAYARSGIAEAVSAAGGEMEVMNPNKFKKTKIPQGISIQEWPVYQDVLACDLLVDVPIAKHHGLARLTLGGKNLLGVIERRSSIHADLGQRIADLISLIKPGLTVVDAVRILMNNGPTGGSLDDVKLTNTIIASHDIVAADSFATGLFNLTGNDIAYIRKASEMGLGTLDIKSINVEETSL